MLINLTARNTFSSTKSSVKNRQSREKFGFLSILFILAFVSCHAQKTAGLDAQEYFPTKTVSYYKVNTENGAKILEELTEQVPSKAVQVATHYLNGEVNNNLWCILPDGVFSTKLKQGFTSQLFSAIEKSEGGEANNTEMVCTNPIVSNAGFNISSKKSSFIKNLYIKSMCKVFYMNEFNGFKDCIEIAAFSWANDETPVLITSQVYAKSVGWVAACFYGWDGKSPRKVLWKREDVN